MIDRLRVLRRALGSRHGAVMVCLAVGLMTGCGARAEAAGATATVTMRYSRFAPQVVTVQTGVPVVFTLRNDDPIEHEWIVGPEAVHAAHRTGTEAYHAERPEEVTVPAYQTRRTTVTFAKPGEYAFICHLPGHEAYGMRGVVVVK